MGRGGVGLVERSGHCIEVQPIFDRSAGRPLSVPIRQVRDKTSYKRDRVGYGAHVGGLRRPCLVDLEIGRGAAAMTHCPALSNSPAQT